MILYLLDVHYLTEEVEYDGEIREPGTASKNSIQPMNLENINFVQLGAFIIAIPLLLLYQI